MTTFSELGLMRSALVQHSNTTWSETFEIMKLGYSSNKRFVYVRITLGLNGQETRSNHSWRDVSDLESKWTIVDILGVSTY